MPSVHWLRAALDEWSVPDGWGYAPGARPASECAALAALALDAHGRTAAADAARAWLAEVQNADGSLGIVEGQADPCWPTPLAMLAWESGAHSSRAPQWRSARDRAAEWLLRAEGERLPRQAEMGHDSMLPGWPWVLGTHSWVEPTAWSVLALQRSGRGQASRAQDGVRLLLDRLLPEGGCNYGNTVVLGQTLRPHVQPSGLALLALAGDAQAPVRCAASLRYLRSSLMQNLTASSLAYALLALQAHEAPVEEAGALCEAAAQRTRTWAAYRPRLALLALAVAEERHVLLPVQREAVA